MAYNAFINGRAVFNEIYGNVRSYVDDPNRLATYFRNWLQTNSPKNYPIYFGWGSLKGDGLAQYYSGSARITLDYNKLSRARADGNYGVTIVKIFVHEYTHCREYARYGHQGYSSSSPKRYYFSQNQEMNAWASDTAIELSRHLTDTQIRNAINNGEYAYLKQYSWSIRQYWNASTPLFREFMRRVLWVINMGTSNTTKVPEGEPPPAVRTPPTPRQPSRERMQIAPGKKRQRNDYH